ncbi:hypothetical protein J7L48_02765, partial [bacterium]|nr:hypothetical protein [bacterium]
ALTSLDVLRKELTVLPRSTTWLPELLSIAVIFLVLLRFALLKKLALDIKYIILIMLFILILLASSLLNFSNPGVVIIGIRIYLKSMPFFLLPAVLDVNDKVLKTQLKFIFALMLLQCPVALYQRFIQYGLTANGDFIRGTLDTASVLSISLISTIAILNGLYQKKIIKFKQFLILSLILFLPATINETKITLFYLPVAIAVPFILIKEFNFIKKFKKIFTLVLIGIILLGVFIPIYDHFMKPHWGFGIIDFFKTGKAIEYLYSGTESADENTWKRGDQVTAAYRSVSKDIGTFLFGYGPGNVVSSYFKNFQNKNIDSNVQSGALALTNFLWETGFLGLIVYILFILLILKDSHFLSKNDSLMGAFSLGWCGVTLMIFIQFFHSNILIMNIINYLFWYFSGVVASQAYRMRHLKNHYAVQYGVKLRSSEA